MEEIALTREEKRLLVTKRYRESHKDQINERAKFHRKNKHDDIRLQSKKYRDANRDEILEKQREFYKNNKDITVGYSRKCYIKHKNERALAQVEYRKANSDRVKAHATQYLTDRRNTDPIFKLKSSVRNLARYAFGRVSIKKQTKTEKMLGCTFVEFKVYIEGKFEDWMTWQNRGSWNGYPKELNTSWDIDHIIPISTANTEEDVIRLSHYTNLRPLCSVINRKVKRAKTNFKQE